MRTAGLTKKLQKLAIVFIVLSFMINALGSMVQFSFAASAYSTLGTNKALGSPILNKEFQSDDWNKWEMIVWGIFLSNFTTPFVDDYNSAFNLDSGYGSKGSGAKALQFGSGMDVQNNQTIQDLLNYAINQQMRGSIKQIYVSYSDLEDGQLKEKTSFDGTAAVTPEAGASDGTTEGASEATVGESTSIETKRIRTATVKDLFFTPTNMGDKNTTWANSTANEGWFNSGMIDPTNYCEIIGTTSGSLPTFAIKGVGGSYKTILDYTDPYDLDIMTLVVSKGLCGDFADEFKKQVNKIFSKPEDYPIMMDCFGNICTTVDGTYRVIVQAAANKHLTNDPSINLVNSLVFNSATKTVSNDQLIIHGGQSKNTWAFVLPNDINKGGVPAFSNRSDGIPAGCTLIYYDTDTIVYQDYLKNGSKKVNTGELFSKLYKLNIENYLSGDYRFKLEPANMLESNFSGLDKEASKALKNMILTTTQLNNQLSTPPDEELLTYILMDGRQEDIFGKPIAVNVQISDSIKTDTVLDKIENFISKSNVEYKNTLVLRRFAEWVHKYYGEDYEGTYGRINSSDVQKAFAESKEPEDLFRKLLLDSNGAYLTPLVKNFIAYYSDMYTVNDRDALNNLSYKGLKNQCVQLLFGQGLSNSKAFELKPEIDDISDDTTISIATNFEFFRTALVHNTSEKMQEVAAILGLRDGTEFAVYSAYIYLTYLDWYGVISNYGLGENRTSKLDPSIFDENSDVLKIDINSITRTTSEAEKEKAVLDWTYKMLNPTEGREYRSNIIMSGISDWIYNNYLKIVYGNSSSYSSELNTNITSRNSTGFLSVPTYTDNFMTSWFMKNYSLFAVYMIGIGTVLIIIIGLLKQRKFSWFMMTLIVSINIILVLPASGEIVPLVSNNYVQNMFQDKMSYWAISESVTNATMEADYVSSSTLSSGYMSSLTKEEQAQVLNMVKSLNVLNLDRCLNIRQDISQKVIQNQSGTLDDIQKLQTTRWMLPMLMRQFSASDGSANYVYVPLGDYYDDLSNMYWYFKPGDASFVNTVNAKQTIGTDGREIPSYDETGGDNLKDINNRVRFFSSYTDTLRGYDEGLYDYKQKSYSINPENLPHTYSYMIQYLHMSGEPMPTYSDYKNYDEWAKEYTSRLIRSNNSEMETIERYIEQYADKYYRFDRSTVNQIYGYLWATQNPFHYFYQGIKDSFKSSDSLGSVVGELQGVYVVNDDGKEVRKTFMHDTETGYVKDVLDLEDMFTNMIPYLYSVQLLAEGYDDVPGIFEDGDKIDNISIYKENNKSWLFRSNWVTKLMENKDYHSPAQIQLSDGTKVTVANMMLPECYEEAGRPMVFSEAQMYELGLDETDLSLIELKCIKVNKDVSKEWTLLLNYASLRGMTKEVMIRQMALDSLLTFNSEFSPIGVFNGAYSMYPTAIDLRAISFDSVMKMLMLNVTHDTSYIYGDTMKTVVEDSDIFTALLLLATALICSTIIPFVRNVALGLIFYLGVVSMAWAIFRSIRTKTKISCGFIVSNVLFTVITIIYYAFFAMLMKMTTSDEVLTITEIEVNVGNPVWCLIFVLLISLLYCWAMYKMICFCFRHYRDMGFEVYAGVVEMASGGLANAIDSLGARLMGSDTTAATSGGGRGRGSSREGNGQGTSAYDYGSGQGSGDGSGSSNSSGSKSKKQNNGNTDYGASYYRDENKADSSVDPSVIDAKIARGKTKNTAKATIDVAQFNDIEKIDFEIESQKDFRSMYRKNVEEFKQMASQENKRGDDPSLSIRYANEYREKELEASANLAALEKRKKELINQNKNAGSHNQDIIDNI